MGMVIFGILASFAAYVLGSAVEIMPAVNAPGLGIMLGVLVMGGCILFQLRKK